MTGHTHNSQFNFGAISAWCLLDVSYETGHQLMGHGLRFEKKAEPIIFNTDAEALLWNSLLLAVVLTLLPMVVKLWF